MPKKPAILPLGYLHPAHRAAVDAGGGNAGKKAAVKARVAAKHRVVVSVSRIERHAGNDTRMAGNYSPFSDMCVGARILSDELVLNGLWLDGCIVSNIYHWV
jgi:hypothetical protein